MNPLSPRDSQEAKAIQLHHAHQVCGITAHTQDRGVASVSIRSIALVAEVIEDLSEQQEIVSILEKIDHDTGWKLAGIIKQLRSVWRWDKMDQSGGLVASATLQPPRHPGTPNSLSSRGSSLSVKVDNAGPQQRLSGPATYAVMQPSKPPSFSSSYQQDHSDGTLPRHHQPMQQAETPMQTPNYTTLPPASAPAEMPSSRRPSMAVATSTAPVAAPRPMRVNPLSFADFSLPNHPYQNWYEPPNRPTSNISYQSQTLFR